MRCRTRQFLIACIATFAAIAAPASLANPVCLSTPPEGGVGGTGRSFEATVPVRGGIGGTGSPQAGGVGGTGHSNAGGIGGTGVVEEGGVGGTGARATNEGGVGGTGIVGTITGFASVCVNGLEVHYDQGTPVQVNGRNSSLSEMAVGQVVSIDAMATDRGMVARDIRMINPIEGPITAIDAGRGRLQVMGRDLVVPPGLEKKLSGLAVGMAVQISGLVNGGGHLVVSRLEARSDVGQASVVGLVMADRVQGVTVQGSLSRNLLKEVMATGHWNGSELVAQSIQVDPVLPGRDRLDHAVVEGYVQTNHSGRAVVAGFELAGAKAAGLAQDRPVIISGRIADGRLQVGKVELEPKFRAERSPGTSVRFGTSSGSVKTEVELPAPTDIPELVDRPETVEIPDKIERPETVERPDKTERPEKIERPEAVDRPEKVERPEKVDRPETIDRPQKIERPEKVEAPDRVEKPEVERH